MKKFADDQELQGRACRERVSDGCDLQTNADECDCRGLPDPSIATYSQDLN